MSQGVEHLAKLTHNGEFASDISFADFALDVRMKYDASDLIRIAQYCVAYSEKGS